MRLLSKSRGFTLIEVLVALAILAIGILGVTTLFPYALQQTQRAAGLTNAANYTDQEFSRYRAKGFQGLYGRPGAWPGAALLTYANMSEAVEQYRIYGFGDSLPVRLVRAEILNFGRSAGLYKMSVSVPLAGGGEASFVTYMARE